MRITLNPSGRSISCEFVNQHGSDGMRTCSVTYFDEYCQEELLIMSGVTDSDHINLYYGDLLNMHTTYCYVIAASNGTLKVNISGTYLQQPGNYKIIIIYTCNDIFTFSLISHAELDKKPSASGTNEWIIAVATIFPAIVVIAVTVLGIITTICIHKPRGRRSISSVKEKKIK